METLTTGRRLSRAALAAAWRAIQDGRRHGVRSAARAGREHGIEGVSKAEVKRWNDLHAARVERRAGHDPLLIQRDTRPMRTPAWRAAHEARCAERDRLRRQERGAEAAAEARIEATAASLRRAARVARNMGWHVHSSRGRSGRISSYYMTPPGEDRRAPVRVSDHEIPSTPEREYMSEVNGRGSFTGYHGWQILIDGEVTVTRIRRLLTLAAAGRPPEVPSW